MRKIMPALFWVLLLALAIPAVSLAAPRWRVGGHGVGRAG